MTIVSPNELRSRCRKQTSYHRTRSLVKNITIRLPNELRPRSFTSWLTYIVLIGAVLGYIIIVIVKRDYLELSQQVETEIHKLGLSASFKVEQEPKVDELGSLKSSQIQHEYTVSNSDNEKFEPFNVPQVSEPNNHRSLNLITHDAFIDANHNDLVLLQPYKKYQYDFPCIHQDEQNRNDNRVGITFVKVFKCASTTVHDIAYRLARKRGHCKVFGEHAFAYTLGLKNRDKSKSYLFSFIRDPTARAKSDFYYHGVTMAGLENTLENLKQVGSGATKLNETKLRGVGGFILAFLSTQRDIPEYSFWNQTHPTLVQNPDLLVSSIEKIIEEYDFIGVAERLGESLVALSFLLDLKVEEIVTVSARTSGSYTKHSLRNNCVKIVKPSLTQEMTSYLDSDEWKASTAGDRLLHKIVNARLDNVIDQVIGRNAFESRLLEYNQLMEKVQICANQCSVCSIDGELRSPKSVGKECEKCMLAVMKDQK